MINDMPKIRIANKCDSLEMKNIDTVVPKDTERSKLIDEWLINDLVLVAEYDTTLVGYAVLNHSFFRRETIEMLMIQKEFRGRKIGELLVTNIESYCKSKRLFVSTNQSNFQMQKLLRRLDFRLGGYIHELDPGDPELIFVKDMRVARQDDTQQPTTNDISTRTQ